MTQKRKSNNPAGRPKPGEAFTEVLRAALDKRFPGAEHLPLSERKLKAKELIALRIISLLVTGRAEMQEGQFMRLPPRVWVDLVKFTMNQVDKTLLDPEADGYIKAYFSIGPDDL